MLMDGAIISAVNAAEVISKQADLGAPPDMTLSYLRLAGIEILSFDAADALEIGDLRAATRDLGLSFGDCACVAVGLKLSLTVVTSDRAWSKLELNGHYTAPTGVDFILSRITSCHSCLSLLS